MQKKLLNLYPQEAWHDEIFIAANLSAMNSLYTSFKSLANSNNDEYFELTDSDFYSSENINTKIVFKIIPYSEFKKLSSTYFGKGFDYLQQDESFHQFCNHLTGSFVKPRKLYLAPLLRHHHAKE